MGIGVWVSVTRASMYTSEGMETVTIFGITATSDYAFGPHLPALGPDFGPRQDLWWNHRSSGGAG